MLWLVLVIGGLITYCTIAWLIDKNYCRIFGHDYSVWGHVWYPWGVIDWYPYDKPRCKHCKMEKI